MNVTFSYQSARLKVDMIAPMEGILHSLYSQDRQRGHATNLMQMVETWADLNGITLYLAVQEYGNPRGLPNDLLRLFYMRFGFRDDVEVPEWPIHLVREPLH